MAEPRTAAVIQKELRFYTNDLNENRSFMADDHVDDHERIISRLERELRETDLHAADKARRRSKDRSRDEAMRLQLRLSPTAANALEKLQMETEAETKTEVVRKAISLYATLTDATAKGQRLVLDPAAGDLYREVQHEPQPLVAQPTPTAPSQPQQIVVYKVIENRDEIMSLATAVRTSLFEYETQISYLGHNGPPEYEQEIAELRKAVAGLKEEIAELRAAVEKIDEKDVEATANAIQRHLDDFLKNFTPIAGKGMAILLVATIATLLAKLGIESDVLGAALDKLIQ